MTVREGLRTWKPFPRRRTPWSLALMALFIVGCGGTRAAQSDEPFSSTGRPPRIRLLVQNRNFADARLYAIRRGSRDALGIVGGKQDAEFTLDWVTSEDLQIEIDMLAGPRCRTEALQVDPGDILELQIDVVFNRSATCG